MLMMKILGLTTQSNDRSSTLAGTRAAHALCRNHPAAKRVADVARIVKDRPMQRVAKEGIE